MDGVNTSSNYLTWVKYTMNLIIDNKYFKVHFTAYSDGVYESLEDLEAEEVFPKQIIIYI